jgi:hypothetical protein
MYNLAMFPLKMISILKKNHIQFKRKLACFYFKTIHDNPISWLTDLCLTSYEQYFSYILSVPDEGYSTKFYIYVLNW